MPFRNEHASRQTEPGKYDTFRRGILKPGVSAIYGIKDGKSEIQSIRFNSNKFTPEQAKAWLKRNNFRSDKFETATKKVEKSFWYGVL